MTINHALSSLASFYAFHLHFGRGSLINPVPEAVERRLLLAHRSPVERVGAVRRAPLRQRSLQRVPRSIPEPLWDELFAAMRHDRNRALLACYVSSGARAAELLGIRGQHVDWAAQRIWVVSKGSRRWTRCPPHQRRSATCPGTSTRTALPAPTSWSGGPCVARNGR